MEAEKVIVSTPIIANFIFLGFQIYHLYPMFVLALIVCGAPFWDDLIYHLNPTIEKIKTFVLMWSNILLFALVEDALYFVILRIPIKPEDWTSRWGYINIGFTVIPYWYIASAIILAFSYYYVLKPKTIKPTITTRVERFLQKIQSHNT
jgi:hypothetical protein